MQGAASASVLRFLNRVCPLLLTRHIKAAAFLSHFLTERGVSPVREFRWSSNREQIAAERSEGAPRGQRGLPSAIFAKDDHC
jgi:hypothetical protein